MGEGALFWGSPFKNGKYCVWKPLPTFFGGGKYVIHAWKAENYFFGDSG